MAQQDAPPTYTNTRDVSVYPLTKQVNFELQNPTIEASAPPLTILFPHISDDAIDMFLYQIQTFPKVKELYDTFPLRMVLECINIHPYMWNTLTFDQQQNYLDIYSQILVNQV